jgi:acyl carrier protein
LLCRIWEEVLEVAPIGIYDNFFELGGHSLKATRLVSRIREAFYVELPVSCIFDEPSVEALSKCVEGLLIEAAGDDELNRLISELDA